MCDVGEEEGPERRHVSHYRHIAWEREEGRGGMRERGGEERERERGERMRTGEGERWMNAEWGERREEWELEEGWEQ